MSSVFTDSLEKILTKYGITSNEEQLLLFGKFYELLIEKNKKMNLTRITEPYKAALKHFYDSLSVLKFIDLKKGSKLIDIGTGAGFPGIPVKIARPDLDITLLDSSAKKTDFAAEAAKSLGIDVKTLCARAEALARDNLFREEFDYALSRAVAPLNLLLELCVPFVKTGGVFIAYKGADYKTELDFSASAIKILDTQVKDIFYPYEERAHALIVFEKLKAADIKFPRKFSAIKKRPL